MKKDGELKLIPPTPCSRPALSLGAPDIVRQFLVWAQRASSERRAEAASALARAYLHSELAPSQRADAMVAITALLDDPSILVRRALAEALAGARDAPRHVTLALANDHSQVAAAVLARSPILTDAELVECAAIGDVVAQCAVARRANLGAGPSAALAEIGNRQAAIALIDNQGANLSARALRRLFERFSDDAEAREALLRRPVLEASLKADIALATARDLSRASAGWLGSGRSERAAREAAEQTIISIAATCRSEERCELVRGLRKSGALTIALLLRSLLGGDRGLFVAAIAELTNVPHPRAAAFVGNPRGEGFAALTRRARLPKHALIAFRAALCALESYDAAGGEGLKSPLVKRVVAACEEHKDPALAGILSLLWRFAAEAARTEARRVVRGAAADASWPPQTHDFPSDSGDEGGESPPLERVSACPGTGPKLLIASVEKADGELLAAPAPKGDSERDEPPLPRLAIGLPTTCARAPEPSIAPDGSGGVAPLPEAQFGRAAGLERAA